MFESALRRTGCRLSFAQTLVALSFAKLDILVPKVRYFRTSLTALVALIFAQLSVGGAALVCFSLLRHSSLRSIKVSSPLV